MSTVSPQLQIPVGFRFLPTKEEILCDYLQPFIKGDPIPSGVMEELDIYGENREPWNIFNQDSAEESFWVITKLKKKSKSRIERTAGDGCWLQQYIKEVKNSDGGEVIGYDKYFKYTRKKSQKSNGQWSMHEFSLKDQEALGLSDYVICEIKNKDAAVVSRDYEECEGEINKKKKRKLMEVPSTSTNHFAFVPVGNQAFDYMAPEAEGFSPSPPFTACPSTSTNDFAFVPVGNQAFDYMAPEAGGFSPSPHFTASLNQQPNPWTSAGVGCNLGVPHYNSHHLEEAREDVNANLSFSLQELENFNFELQLELM